MKWGSLPIKWFCIFTLMMSCSSNSPMTNEWQKAKFWAHPTFCPLFFHLGSLLGMRWSVVVWGQLKPLSLFSQHRGRERLNIGTSREEGVLTVPRGLPGLAWAWRSSHVHTSIINNDWQVTECQVLVRQRRVIPVSLSLEAQDMVRRDRLSKEMTILWCKCRIQWEQ